MGDSTDDDDLDEPTPMEEWRSLHYQACSICSGTAFVDGLMVILPGLDKGGNLIPGKGVRCAPIVCMSCGYTVLVSTAVIKPKPLPKGAEDA